MKDPNLIISATIFSIICFFTVSCSDFLSVKPKDKIPSEEMWATTANADFALNDVYSGILGTHDSEDPLDNWTDNSMTGISSGRFSRNIYSKGIYTPSNISSGGWRAFGWEDASWEGLYTSIRKANNFIAQTNKSSLADEWKKKRLPEARFLRAYFYSQLWTRFGGVPVITEILDQKEQGDKIFRPRNTAEETYNFIINELEAIASDLPIKTEENGRATKGAALTLKAWCELFWASPLYNENNNKSKWEKVASTYKTVMDLGVYNLFPDYNAQFMEDNNWNIETIFAESYLGGTDIGGSREGLQGAWSVKGKPNSYGGVNPTQELVDAYFMANGLPIEDSQSGYDPQNPYANRGERFYQSIAFDGTEWLGDTLVMKQGVGSINATDISNKLNATVTGYYLLKGLNPDYAEQGHNKLNSANFIIFRYAGVLLGYAEAQNEYSGPDASVYKAINQVRERVDLPPLEKGLTQKEMRAAIYHERRVELAFEGKRWYDLLRLKLAEKKLNGTLHAMVIEKEGGQWKYNVKPAADGSVTFDPENNYLLPIPIEAMERNPNLEQNPGY